MQNKFKKPSLMYQRWFSLFIIYFLCKICYNNNKNMFGGEKMKKKFFFVALFWSMIMVVGQLFGAIYAILEMAFTNPNFMEDFMKMDTFELISQISNPMLIGGVIAVLITVIIRISTIKNENKTWTQKCKDYLNLKPLKNGMEYVRYFCVGISINVFLSLILTGLYKWLELEDDTAYMFDSGWIMLLLVSFLVPIMEEILYRNRIYIAFKNLSPKRANFWQALFFGIAHGNIIQGLYTFLFGIMFGKINDRNNSLLPSICIHCGINFFAGITMFSPGSEIYLIPFIIFAIPKFLEWIQYKKLI